MAVTLKPLPPREAIAAFQARGGQLEPTFSYLDMWQEDHASAFTVAKSAGFDILNDLFDAFNDELTAGGTAETFARKIRPTLMAKGWWGRQMVRDPASGELRPAQLGSTRRLDTIFDANMRVSYAAGHWASFERNKASRPFLRYVAVLDERTRPMHRARHNLVLPVDHPYWNTWAPPCGWHCRCTLQSLSQRDIDRLQREGEQLMFEPPEDTFRTFTNWRTGEISRVPDGIDPGWAYNPGKAGYQATLRVSEKLVEAPPELAAEVNAAPNWLLRPMRDEFRAWFDDASAGRPASPGVVVVGALPSSVVERLGAAGNKPASGAIAVDQKSIRHMLRDAKALRGQAVASDMLRDMPELVSRPKAILRDIRSGALLYVFDVPGDPRLGKLVIRLDFAMRVRGPSGQETIRPNAIRTAGLVEPRVLTDRNAYELISGEL